MTNGDHLMDLRALMDQATAVDLARVRESADLITARGGHRDRNLADELERLLPRACGAHVRH